MGLSDRLKKARLRAGLKQQQVADHLGVTRSSVSQWEQERHRSKPTYHHLKELAALYGVSLDDLIGHPLSTGIDEESAPYGTIRAQLAMLTGEELEVIEKLIQLLLNRRSQ